MPLSVAHMTSRALPRRLEHVFERTARVTPEAVALDHDGTTTTYAQLEARANQLAHRLRRDGVGTGSRVAILLARSPLTYVALLGVLKAGAAFVPIDPEAPADRVAYIAEDAAVDLVVTSSELAGFRSATTCPALELDTRRAEIDACPTTRPAVDHGSHHDPPAYVIYTSGSSGRPKGVEIAQSSIVNFLDVVPDVYDVRPDDRVYQGMTISFDFSIEEIWPTFARGATLVIGPDDSRRLGGELADFLEQARVSVLYCVPTLLATLPRDLPGLRSVLVGGEACPAELVDRWSRPGRRMLNTYGPTEATVTATWCELLPGRPVTIGRAVPTYSIVLLDEHCAPVPDGAVGEICIGGPGVANGYVGLPEKTADRFVEHPLAPGGGRLYRTGDLGRLTDDGEIEYRGRADAEVKVRGHRVDLGEIESVLLTDAAVGAAVVTLVEETGSLAAYVVPPHDAEPPDIDELAARLHGALHERLPEYMIPSTLDLLGELPTMPSGKVDRTKLPAPSGRRLVGDTGPVVEAEGQVEERLREMWAGVFGLRAAELSVEADFFTDLGGHSLLAATVVTRMREQGANARAGGSVALRDLYAHPTVRALAAHLAQNAATPVVESAPRPEPDRHSDRRVARAGLAQAVLIYGFLLAATLPVAFVYTRNDGTVSVAVLLQLLGAVVATYLGTRWILPLLVRPLTAGIRPGRYPLWGVTYVRLWFADLLLGASPLPVLSGSMAAGPYLRLLGASVGDRTTIATSTISVPRLVRIGDDAAIGYGVHIRPWEVRDGTVTVGTVVVGRDAFVGANAILGPGTTVGAEAALGEQSVLDEGEEVPDGHGRAGSPPRPVTTLGPAVEEMLGAPPARGWRWYHVLATVAGVVGLEAAAVAMVVPAVGVVWGALLLWGVLAGLASTLLAGPVYVVTVCAIVLAGKRLVLPRLPAGIHLVRSGLGIRKWIADTLFEFSLSFTNALYATLYTVPWLRLLGARVGRGAEVSTAAHLDPDLLVLGRESFVADMASVGSASFAHGRVARAPTASGARSFVGNAALVPAGTRTGEGSLLGVQSVPPAEGVPQDSSWLGSPAIHLPRRQDSGDFDEASTYRPAPRVVRQRLAVEFCRATLPGSVIAVSVYLYLLALSALAQGRALPEVAFVAPVLAIAAALLVVLYVAAVKRNVVGVYRPRVEPLWSPFVRRTEFVTGMYEAAAVPVLLGLLVGTPALPAMLRLMGARIGRRVWIGTTYLTEFDLVEVGDDACIGTAVSLQTHLFEDRVMKMSVLRIGDGASVGTRSVVLYDAVVGEGVALGPLSLLMKGEELPAGTDWRGIPAQGATPAPLAA
ncbi:MAG TPA: Pls/PosA family non-ribosomal peptide synthetase [Actinomycetospora sp.]|nr:Pls/PosA family non-ribosomal peptide synthetase [Actinomycetospora sp.]